MNKNLIIGIVALLLIGGGGYYFMTKGSVSTPTTPSSETSSQQPATAFKSLKDLLMSGVAQKCTFTDKSENVDMNGTTYVANGKMRGDFNSSVNGKVMVSHMIVDGKTSYMWTDDTTTGFKFAFDPQSTEETQADESDKRQGSVDINKTMDYKCNPSTVDGSMFTPPANVKFTDYSQMMGPSSSGKTGTGVNPGCSACDSLEGDDQAQCRAALKCS